jgi:transcriptional regulator with XRE-family HTH domain
MLLGETIRSLRSAKGWSQQDFARRLGISPSYLSLVEKNKREPALPLLRRMADTLGAPSALLIAAAIVGSDSVVAGRDTERDIVRRLVESAALLISVERVSDHFPREDAD